MKRISSYIVLLLMLTACSSGSKKSTDSRPKAFVAITPYRYAVETITQGKFEVLTLISEGQNPHNFTPTPKQIAKLSQAKVYFSAGLEFEKSVIKKIKELNDSITIVNLQEGIPLRYMGHEDHGSCTGHHGDEAADPHIWLSPVLYKKQARLIYSSLVSLNTDWQAPFTEGLDTLEKELDLLDQRLQKKLLPLAGENLFVYHPSFGYFADRYGLHQKAIETGGKEPSARELARTIEEIEENNAKVLFVQEQFSTKSAAAIARQTGSRIAQVNPMPVDYITDMDSLGSIISSELRP